MLRTWIPILLATVCSVVAVPAAAQSSTDVPTIRELEAGNEPARAPLVITSPVAGAEVAPPFTVEGTGPPGARLELWLGGALARVFRTDSDGNFTTAVSDAPSGGGPIAVHQIGERERRIQSASVDVLWSSAKRARSAPVGAEPDRTVPAPDSAPVPTEGAASVAEDEMPRTPELDPDTLESAPAPPPVDQVLRPAGSPEEVAESSTPESREEREVAEEEEERRPSAGAVTTNVYTPTNSFPRPLRLGLQFLAGGVGLYAGATAGALLGAGVGLLASGGGSNEPVFVATTVIGGFAGGLAGTATGVWVTGQIIGADGKFLPTLLGTLIGGVAGGLIGGTIIVLAPDASPAIGAVVLGSLSLGGVIGYELSTSGPLPSAASGRPSGSLRLAPSFGSDHAGMTLRATF